MYLSNHVILRAYFKRQIKICLGVQCTYNSCMNKPIKWNPEKANLLKEDKTRNGVTFEDCVIALEGGGILDIVENPSSNHTGQLVFVLNIGGYAHNVPFVETEDEIFLKTVFPHRGNHRAKRVPLG